MRLSLADGPLFCPLVELAVANQCHDGGGRLEAAERKHTPGGSGAHHSKTQGESLGELYSVFTREPGVLPDFLGGRVFEPLVGY